MEMTPMDELPYRVVSSSPTAHGAPDQSEVRTATRAETPRTAIQAAEAQLRGRAFLYDDPDAYAAGVRDALSELNARLDARPESPAPSERNGI